MFRRDDEAQPAKILGYLNSGPSCRASKIPNPTRLRSLLSRHVPIGNLRLFNKTMQLLQRSDHNAVSVFSYLWRDVTVHASLDVFRKLGPQPLKDVWEVGSAEMASCSWV